MKKFLMTLIVSLAMCGSMFAQYTSHWENDYYGGDYEDYGTLVAAIIIDGEIVTPTTMGWEALEVAPFVGDQCRGNTINFLYDGITEFGDTYLTLNAMPINYNDEGETVTFKLYNHLTGGLYENCAILYQGSDLTILTGETHEEGWDDPDEPVFLSFTSTTVTKDIVGHGGAYGHYYLIASPMVNAVDVTTTDMIAATEEDYDLYYFDQAEAMEWRNYKDAAFDLVNGMGYLYASKDDRQINFTGSVNDGNSDVFVLSRVAGAAFEGWNLIGNPYNEDAHFSVARDFYVLNYPDADAVVAATTATIAALEGVFVTAAYDGEQVVIEKGASTKGSMVALNLTQNNRLVDRAIVRFDSNRQLPKFQLRESSKVFMTQDGRDYAVLSAEPVGEMPVSFKAETSGTYTLSFTAEDAQFSYLHLIDNLTGNDVDLLATPSYTFDANYTDYASRFRLVFAKGNAEDSFAYINNGEIILNGVNGNTTVNVFDASGRLVNTTNANHISTENMAAGVYMIQLINGENVQTQKIVVK